MKRFKVLVYLAVASVCCLSGLNGCTKAPSKEDATKLEESRAAAENAEKKLFDLKQERMKLEADTTKK